MAEELDQPSGSKGLQHGDQVSRLLANAKNNVVDRHGRGPLYEAAIMKYCPNYTSLLRLLLESGAHPESELNLYKPFSAVVENGDLDSVKLMIEYGINPVNYVNQLILYKALNNPRLEVLEFLLCMGHFDPNEMDLRNGTPLYKAIEEENPEAIQVLLNYGARPNIACYKGLTPLHHVKYDTESDKVTKCIDILLRHGADGDALDKGGKSALYKAAIHPPADDKASPRDSIVNTQKDLAFFSGWGWPKT
ncbi:hypothetical protein QAD02_004649 [Eretmocerus hayati]|uniref:Uncharacterized protein n=1 Tax=Eretmocerus hayati TaxID=131215 RepID=A0ACC2NQI9_9HYME|nr:hypothetical protein QAD02_004649 [Eretmocerus hayati]